AFAEAESIPTAVRAEVFAVYLADLLAIRLGFGTGGTGIAMPLASYASMLPKTTLETLLNHEKVIAEMKRIAEIEF
ncbi:MAG: hypothetical protein R8M45_08470, partial [Ghiorsea sp.]